MTLEESAITATLGGPTQILAPESPQDAQLFQAVEELLDFVCDQGWSKTVIAANYARLPNILVMDDENSRESTLAELIFMVLMDLVKQGGAKMIGNINKPEYEGLRRILGVLSNYLLPLVPASIDSKHISTALFPIAFDTVVLVSLSVLYPKYTSVMPDEWSVLWLVFVALYVRELIIDVQDRRKSKRNEPIVNKAIAELHRCFPQMEIGEIRNMLENILKLLEGTYKES